MSALPKIENWHRHRESDGGRRWASERTSMWGKKGMRERRERAKEQERERRSFTKYRQTDDLESAQQLLPAANALRCRPRTGGRNSE